MKKLRIPLMSEAEILDDLDFTTQMEDLRWKRIDEECDLQNNNPGRKIVTCCKACNTTTVRQQDADFCPSCQTYRDVRETSLQVM